MLDGGFPIGLSEPENSDWRSSRISDQGSWVYSSLALFFYLGGYFDAGSRSVISTTVVQGGVESAWPRGLLALRTGIFCV